MRRTTLAALCLTAATAVTALGVTGYGAQERAGNGGGSNNGNGSATQPTAPTGRTQSPTPTDPFPGLTGGQIAERALSATTAAGSLRMRGDLPEGPDGDPLRLDLAVGKNGDCVGTLGFDGGGTADLIKTGDSLYLRYDEAFLRAQGEEEGESRADTDAAVALLADRWTRTSADGADAADIQAFCDLDTVLSGTGDVHSDATRGATTTVDGTPAIALHEKDGVDTYTLHVATEGEPYLLRVDGPAASSSGSGGVVLTDHGRPVAADEPSGEILDLDALDALDG
ncbi:hypothetical protein ABZX40_19605 [Streptomyces sp. NPDC004610]|uniref:hypothetical protein n=1 Tax=unclassified Streptomyces TaxID=2593676 RepID=UPI0033B22A48